MPAPIMFGRIQRDFMHATISLFSDLSLVASLKDRWGYGSTGLVSTWRSGKAPMPVGALHAVLMHADPEDRVALASIVLRGTGLVVVNAPEVENAAPDARTRLLIDALVGDLARHELAATDPHGPGGSDYTTEEKAERIRILEQLQRTVTTALERERG